MLGTVGYDEGLFTRQTELDSSLAASDRHKKTRQCTGRQKERQTTRRQLVAIKERPHHELVGLKLIQRDADGALFPQSETTSEDRSI